MKPINAPSLNFDRMGGLLPAVVQSSTDHQVLMLAYMSPEALQETIKTGRATFYSRSRKSLWTKGETSGNYLMVDEILADCDEDALLLRVRPEGPCCHLDRPSCFTHFDFLYTLEQVIKDRKQADPNVSYVSRLFQAGTERICRKVGEEALETVLASMQRDPIAIREEAADLLFHLIINLSHHSIPLAEVIQILKNRHEEKK
jgi:phosphoribosyl-ATP pyrophosphohydrolase/phosphoribosyl-AMP cyclohydrolase